MTKQRLRARTRAAFFTNFQSRVVSHSSRITRHNSPRFQVLLLRDFYRHSHRSTVWMVIRTILRVSPSTHCGGYRLSTTVGQNYLRRAIARYISSCLGLNGGHYDTLESPPSPVEFSRICHISRPVLIKGEFRNHYRVSMRRHRLQDIRFPACSAGPANISLTPWETVHFRSLLPRMGQTLTLTWNNDTLMIRYLPGMLIQSLLALMGSGTSPSHTIRR